MILMLPESKSKCLMFDISRRTQSDGKTRKTTKVAAVGEYVQYKADGFRNIEDINKIVAGFMEEGNVHKAVLFIFGINTGFRCGDILTLRVKDVTDVNGEILPGIYLFEQKTGKGREVIFNEAVRTALRYHIDRWELKPDSFIWESRTNRALYLDGFLYDAEGNVKGMQLVSQKYQYIGDQKIARQAAPTERRTASDWIKKQAVKQKIEGHFSSHCMRKTFAHFVGIDWSDEYNSLAVQKALGHSSVDITTTHYLTVDDSVLKERWRGLNLGLEAFKKYIEE